MKAFSVKVPRGHRWGVFRQWLRGLFRGRKGGDGPPDAEKVRYYFMARSVTDGFGDFLDAATPWYIEWLAKSRRIPDLLLHTPEAIRILDYGCGQGGLAHWIINLRGSRPTHILGVDFNDAAIGRCRGLFPPSLAEFHVHDAATPEPEAWGRFDAIFCVNLLPYLADPLPLLTRLRQRLGERKPIFVIVDPIPSAHWDVDYGTFRAILRKPAEIDAIMQKASFKIVERGILHGLSILGIPALALSGCSIYIPTEGMNPAKAPLE